MYYQERISPAEIYKGRIWRLLLKDAPKELYYSVPPKTLAWDLLEKFCELDEVKKSPSTLEALDNFRFEITRLLEEHIRKEKRNNQLLAFPLPPQTNISFSEKIKEEAKRLFRPFIRHHRQRTRKTYGAKQEELVFPELEPVTLLDLLEWGKLETKENNPLNFL